MNMKKFLFAFCYVLVFSCAVFTQKKNIEVSVEVSAKSTEVKNNVESFITRELRSLNYIDVVNDGGFYKFKVLVIDNQELNIFSVSVVLLRQSVCVSEKVNESCYVYASQSAYLVNENNLRKACEAIATSLDTRLKPIINK